MVSSLRDGSLTTDSLIALIDYQQNCSLADGKEVFGNVATSEQFCRTTLCLASLSGEMETSH